MAYKVVLTFPDGATVEDDEVFESESEAAEYGQYLCDCSRQGMEILHESNPGDNPAWTEEDDEADFEVVEVDDDDDELEQDSWSRYSDEDDDDDDEPEQDPWWSELVVPVIIAVGTVIIRRVQRRRERTRRSPGRGTGAS